MIDMNMIEAIKVQFIKPIFEEDWIEKGMKAWLTDIEWCPRTECYNLYFDFTEFEAYNDKYFKESFYFYDAGGREVLKTAKETGAYKPKYSVYLSVSGEGRNDEVFAEEIKQYLRIVE